MNKLCIENVTEVTVYMPIYVYEQLSILICTNVAAHIPICQSEKVV